MKGPKVVTLSPAGLTVSLASSESRARPGLKLQTMGDTTARRFVNEDHGRD